ncbi:MAG: hypothetical protein U0271_05770 [Polyangiaceae bacterium]
MHRHDPVGVQQRDLERKLNGHYAYYGITPNFDAIKRFQHEVKAIWKKWLSRRSNSRRFTWETMEKLLERYPLPKPRIVHRYARSESIP